MGQCVVSTHATTTRLPSGVNVNAVLPNDPPSKRLYRCVGTLHASSSFRIGSEDIFVSFSLDEMSDSCSSFVEIVVSPLFVLCGDVLRGSTSNSVGSLAFLVFLSLNTNSCSFSP